MAKVKFCGLMPPVFTPFNVDYTINLSVIPKYVNYLSKQNTKGILVNGTSGEGMSLNVEERKLLAETWVKEGKQYGMHIMVQVGGAPLPDVLSLTSHAESIKVDSILTLPELFNKPKNNDELISYLKIISSAAPNTPLLYYHNPGFTDVNLDMTSLVRESKKSIKNFCGLKFTSTDLKEGLSVLEECEDDCIVFLGADQLIAPAFSLGYNSSIGTTFNMISHLSFDICNNLATKNLEKVREQQRKLNNVINVITKHGKWVPTMKAAMEIITDIKVGPPRPPLSSLTNLQLNELKSDLRDCGIL